MEAAEPVSRSAERVGVLIVVIVTTIRAILVGIALLADAGIIGADFLLEYSPIPVFAEDTLMGAVSRGMLVAMLVISLLCAFGLARRIEWGWTLSIVTAGVILALNLGWWASGDPHYLSMVINAIIVFYLNQRDLRVAFKVGQP